MASDLSKNKYFFFKKISFCKLTIHMLQNLSQMFLLNFFLGVIRISGGLVMLT